MYQVWDYVLADWIPNWDFLLDWPGQSLSTGTVPPETGHIIYLINDNISKAKLRTMIILEVCIKLVALSVNWNPRSSSQFQKGWWPLLYTEYRQIHLTLWHPGGFGDFRKKKHLNARGFAQEFLRSSMLYRLNHITKLPSFSMHLTKICYYPYKTNINKFTA